MIYVVRFIAWLIPEWLSYVLVKQYGPALIARAKKTPYFPLPGYMNRWWLAQNVFGLGINIRIHETLRPDADRDLHDHPWDNISVILDGCYWEEMPLDQFEPEGKHVRKLRTPGQIVVRAAEDAHRLETVGPVLSLFITFRKRRAWGFYHKEYGWVYWKHYVDPDTLAPEELEEIRESGDRPPLQA